MKTKELKFKVGDKVRVKSLEWYNENKDGSGEITAKEGEKFGVFHPNMRYWCGDVIKINSVINFGYRSNNCWRWYDWMLEDDVVTEEKQEVEQFEAVTEEKQEVEQLNKKEMETKKMTLQESQEFVKNTKYIVWSEDESRQLQDKLFEIGCEWLHSGKTICHEDHPFLTVDDRLHIRYRERQYYTYFEENKNRYIETHHILNMELEQEQPKPKFDPNTLQPFDKVLVRDIGTDWHARYFELYRDKYFKTTNGGSWRICIPYNDDTKHLLGTSKDAPEFYKLD